MISITKCLKRILIRPTETACFNSLAYKDGLVKAANYSSRATKKQLISHCAIIFK
jgi:hypothetical protein